MNNKVFSSVWMGIITLCFFLSFNVYSGNEEVIVEISKPQKRTFGLGTKGYEPTSKELPFFNKIPKKKDFADDKDRDKYSKILMHKTGEYINWFGILREVVKNKKKNITELIIEMKYFDGQTDLHLQVVSLYGGGDFKILVPGLKSNIPRLSLLCIYGTIVGKTDEFPIVKPEYMRVWDWGLFTFMDYGKDMSNPKWVKMREIKYQRVYSSRPDNKYYEDRLGKRDNSGQKQLLKTEMFDTYFHDHFVRFNFPLEKSLDPILELIKNHKYNKALKELNELETIWKNDKKRTHIWFYYFLYQTKIYIGLSQKDKAIESLLHTAKLPRTSIKDQFQLWGFLVELGYIAPEEKANEVLGCVIDIPSPFEQGEDKYKLTVFKDGDLTLDTNSINGSSSYGLSNRSSDPFRNDVKMMIDSVQYVSQLFSISKDPYGFLNRDQFDYYFKKELKKSSPVLKFVIFTPGGKKELKTPAERFNKNHKLYKLYSLAISLIEKLERNKKK
jgi:hypothetical protein